MSRPLRFELAGSWYHVMNRGANRQNIFFTKEDRFLFLSLLSDVSQEFSVEIHAFCLMNNHYHLLLHTPIANLSKSLRHLNAVYTQYFNRVRKRDGALFRGRYKSILIEPDNYLLQVSKYIHLNPVLASMCKDPIEYQWSSYSFYLMKKNPIKWLKKDFILDMIGKNSIKRYQKFVCDELDTRIKNFYNKKQLPSILGDEKFIAKNLRKVGGKYKSACATHYNQTKNLLNAKQILKIVCCYFEVNLKILRLSTPGKKNINRIIAIYLLRNVGKLSHQKIADEFENLQRRSVGKIIDRCECLVLTDKKINNHIIKLKKMMMNLSNVDT